MMLNRREMRDDKEQWRMIENDKEHYGIFHSAPILFAKLTSTFCLGIEENPLLTIFLHQQKPQHTTVIFSK
jgi:hypothetical protein